MCVYVFNTSKAHITHLHSNVEYRFSSRDILYNLCDCFGCVYVWYLIFYPICVTGKRRRAIISRLENERCNRRKEPASEFNWRQFVQNCMEQSFQKEKKYNPHLHRRYIILPYFHSSYTFLPSLEWRHIMQPCILASSTELLLCRKVLSQQDRLSPCDSHSTCPR